MPILKNARHEVFAQNLASGMSQEEAYIKAGYSRNGAEPNASRLISNDKVALRVAELQSVSSIEAVITAADLSAQLEELRLKAVELGQIGAAVQAVNGRAKLHGLIIDKAEVKDVTEVPPDVRRAEIERLMTKLNGATNCADRGRGAPPIQTAH